MVEINIKKTALLAIDIQQGFSASSWGIRNNPLFEGNVEKIIHGWRNNGGKIYHIRHHSEDPSSPLFKNTKGTSFMNFARPRQGEPVYTKYAHGAFVGTNLAADLEDRCYSFLVMIGLCTDHCVSTSARMACDLGYRVTLISDATATFNRVSVDGKDISADVVHSIHLASLFDEFADVTTTGQLLKGLNNFHF